MFFQQTDGTTLVISSDEGSIASWDTKTYQSLWIIRSDRPYEAIKITDVKGLTDAQILTFKELGIYE